MDVEVALLLAMSAMFCGFAAVAALFVRQDTTYQGTGLGQPHRPEPTSDVVRLLTEHGRQLDMSSRRIAAAIEAVQDLSDAWSSAQSHDSKITAELARLSGRLSDLDSTTTRSSADIRPLTPGETARVLSPADAASQGVGVRELSHALGAPLVQIHSYAQLLKKHIPPGVAASAEFERYRNRILSGVRLCQALLSGYKRIQEIVTQQPGSMDDIEDAVKHLADFFSMSGEDHVRLTVEGDLASTGYSSTLALVLATPLIENAIDDIGDSSSEVSLLASRTDTDLVIQVRNPTNCSVPSDHLIVDGFTTKLGHDGIGLATVERIAVAAGGRLDIDVTDGVFTASVRLPARNIGPSR